jgi:hypothetical protein
MRLGLTLTDNLPEKGLERFHVVVLEHPYVSAAQSCTITDRRMIQLVGDEEAALGDEGGYDCGVGGKAHRGDKRILLSEETGNEGFCGHVQLRGAALESGATCRDAVTTKALLNSICASTLSLSKAKVIVRRNVEAAGRCSSQRKCVVVVLGFTVEEYDRPSRNASDWRGETIIYAPLEPSSEKGVEIRIEWSITLPGKRV